MKLLGAIAAPLATAAAHPGAPQVVASAPASAQQPPRLTAPLGYSSPTMTVDGMTGALIVEYRDVATGEELSQTPSRAALKYGAMQRLAGPGVNGGGDPEAAGDHAPGPPAD